MNRLKLIKPFFLLLILGGIGCVSCSKDEAGKLEEKWQLRHTIHTDGTAQQVDSVFYNFMKGTFSSICIGEEGNYLSYHGIYTLNEGQIKVRLTNESADRMASEQHTSARHMHWSGTTKEFAITVLTGSSLQLVSGEYTYVFRKY